MRLQSLFATAVAVLTLPLSCSASDLNERILLPTLPQDDPFYVPPADFASSPPGTIYKKRAIIVSSVLADVLDVTWQVLYRTTAIDGSATTTVATILVPVGAYTDRFMHFATAYDSGWTGCDPSYNYQLGSLQTDALLNVETTLIDIYLKLGYIVVSSDYEGPNAAFAAGHLSGQALLDSMRAVINFGKALNLTTDDPMVVGVGYSGGALATGWAAGLQPTYAPELNMKGWSLGGTPANLTGVIYHIDDTPYSGFLPSALTGFNTPTAYGAQLADFYNDIMTPAGVTYMAYAASHCGSDEQNNFINQSILDYSFQSLGPELPYNSLFGGILDENIMGIVKSETPTAPLLIYHCENDEIIPFANATTLVHNWCDYGAAINFTIFENGGHVSGAVTGELYQVDFVNNAFAGKLAASGCTTRTVDNIVQAPV